MADDAAELAPGTNNGSLTDVERLLMEEYGIEGEQKIAEAAPPDTPDRSEQLLSMSRQDTTSLDSQSFSVEAWLESRKHLSLEMLLQQQKALRSDITKFRNSTQMLVHDNYSRFIAAADIIRSMRGELQGMVGNTEKLTDNTMAATSASETMNSQLQVCTQHASHIACTHCACARFAAQVRAMRDAHLHLRYGCSVDETTGAKQNWMKPCAGQQGAAVGAGEYAHTAAAPAGSAAAAAGAARAHRAPRLWLGGAAAQQGTAAAAEPRSPRIAARCLQRVQ